MHLLYERDVRLVCVRNREMYVGDVHVNACVYLYQQSACNPATTGFFPTSPELLVRLKPHTSGSHFAYRFENKLKPSPPLPPLLNKRATNENTGQRNLFFSFYVNMAKFPNVHRFYYLIDMIHIWRFLFFFFTF